MTKPDATQEIEATTRILILPLGLISLISYGLIVVLFMMATQSCVMTSLHGKAAMLTKTLANVLGDPLAMGEYDRMQQILRTSQSFEPDMSYAYLLAPDGRVLSSTDQSKKDLMMNASELDKNSLRATGFMESGVPDQPGIVEMDMPVTSGGVKAAVLRVGFSKAGAEETGYSSSLSKLFVIAAVLAIGALVTGMFVRTQIILPILTRSN